MIKPTLRHDDATKPRKELTRAQIADFVTWRTAMAAHRLRLRSERPALDQAFADKHKLRVEDLKFFLYNEPEFEAAARAAGMIG